MLKQALKQLGKSLLIVTGIVYGVVKALDALALDLSPDASSSGARAPAETATSCPPRNDSAKSGTKKPVTTNPADVCAPEALRQLNGMEERLIRMEKSLAVLAAPVERMAPRTPWADTEHFVTRAELNLAMEQLSGSLDTGIERRFEVQNRSVQSLRTMIARTDELLGQVIESIESADVHP